MDEGMLNLRQYKKEKLRENIIESSLDMFFTRGFDKTTIDDITISLEISKRTFFRYFASKEDIVLSLYENLMEKSMPKEPDQTKYGHPMITIKHAFNNLAIFFENQNNFYLKLENLINKTPSIRTKRIEKFIRYGDQICGLYNRKQKRSATSISHENIIVYVSMGIFESAISTWTASNGKRSLSKIVKEGFSIMDKKLTPKFI